MNEDIEFLEKVYGKFQLDKMIENWKKEHEEKNMQKFIERKIKEQCEFLRKLRNDK